MNVSRLRVLDEGYFKYIKLELCQEELDKLLLDLQVAQMYQDELEYTAIDSDPQLKIIFKLNKKKRLQKFAVGVLGLLVVFFHVLGIIFLIQFVFHLLWNEWEIFLNIIMRYKIYEKL
jgi:hypothetical protein